MRTLLIDNHDSFTYNLFHQLCEVNGREPDVVRNDDPHWRPAHLDSFDNVVLSPGPGHPGRARDFGICRDVLGHGRIPVLGVCLGHQGMALLAGARVDRAPQPWHGRCSAVEHTGTGLFAGVPSPFEAVRYHSLAVRDLPAGLEATAWTSDGLLMGLRHRHRSWWGVQFHPESICSHHGTRLLANFRHLSERVGERVGERRLRPGRTVVVPRTARRGRPAQPPERRLRVLVRELPTRWQDEAAFDSLFRHGSHAYWLDSGRPDTDLGRFSVMGDASGPLGRVATADVWQGTVTERSASSVRVHSGAFLDWLEKDLRRTRTHVPGLPCDFALGWVGYLGYELKAECGGERTHRAEDPDAAMVFSDRALVMDHHTGTSYLLALTEDGAGDVCRDALDWLATAERTLHRTAGTAQPWEGPRHGRFGPLWQRHSEQEYLSRISSCLSEIAAGESYEICLTNMLEAPWEEPGDDGPWEAYRALRRHSPAPFGALLRFGGLSVLSSSPERFLRVSAAPGGEGRQTAESRPIKGTRPRGRTPEEDAALVEDLRTHGKDRAENLMIVDLVRNDLGHSAEPGGVRADDIFRVESYATVHQLVSTVEARLRPDVAAVACARAAFPPGSMTGAPKERTMQIIDGLEGGPRGVYSGALGYFSLNGAADLSVVIRTAVLGGGRVRYGVGGAVIALSDPAEEYAETVVKSAPLHALTTAAQRAEASGVAETA